ncbi:MAG: lysylphosphatidylglycerol synthase domain-containing protein [Pseudomonadota bacterium]|nr:lysylphosphatidylglycerol synthase domain-containing protein [Pseudomonadota bacterium]
MTRARIVLAVQALVSLVVIGLLWADAGPGRVRQAFAGVDPAWVAAAAAVQACGLLLRATRVWFAMDRAAPYAVVLKGALTANLGHLLVPTRVADLAGAVWIARRAGLPVERGVAGYATAGFLEALAFGTGLMGLFAGAAPVIEQVMTGGQRREALGWVTLATLGGVAVAAVALRVIGRWSAGPSDPWGRGGGAPPATPPPRSSGSVLFARVVGAAEQARTVLARPGPLALNLLLGAAQIVCMLGVFRCALASVGLEVPAPWLCGALVMATGAVGGLVLPPHYGANTSAAATLVLTPFGATAPEALAFGGVLWFAAAAPDVTLGLVGLWLGGGAAVREEPGAA